jgi:hypothetical protein
LARRHWPQPSRPQLQVEGLAWLSVALEVRVAVSKRSSLVKPELVRVAVSKRSSLVKPELVRVAVSRRSSLVKPELVRVVDHWVSAQTVAAESFS